MYFIADSWPYEGYDLPQFFETLEEALGAKREPRTWREIYKIETSADGAIDYSKVAFCIGKGKWTYYDN